MNKARQKLTDFPPRMYPTNASYSIFQQIKRQQKNHRMNFRENRQSLGYLENTDGHFVIINYTNTNKDLFFVPNNHRFVRFKLQTCVREEGGELRVSAQSCAETELVRRAAHVRARVCEYGHMCFQPCRLACEPVRVSNSAAGASNKLGSHVARKSMALCFGSDLEASP